MGYDSPDPYHQPEKFDLELIATVDRSDGYYQFDYFVVWKHKNGTIYYAMDSGCSCPAPFEECHRLEDLTVADSADQLREAFREWIGDPEYSHAKMDDFDTQIAPKL